jgi:hypothetical protein
MNIAQALKENIPLKGVYTFTLTDIHTGEKEVYVYENVITAAYWELIANNVVDPTPTSMLLTEAVLGSGTSTPATSDTALQTETYRNTIFSKSNLANVASITAFFNATETSGTFREAGLVTGDDILASRVAINITKTTSQTMTFDWTLTISNAS